MIGVAFDGSPAVVPSQRGYQAARRHSVRVKLLKVAIPAGTAVAAGLVAVALYNPFGALPGLSLGSVGLSGSKIAMEGPRLTGFRRDAQPYEVTATAAFQDITKPTVIELKDMKAAMGLDERGTKANLSAAGGVFDTTRERLDLSRDIRVTTTRGESAELASIQVDFKAGTAVSREPVRITTPSGVIEAQGIELTDNGHTISFTGRVRTQFDQRLAVTEGKTPAASEKPPVAGEKSPVAAEKAEKTPTPASPRQAAKPVPPARFTDATPSR